ncbi:MAG: HEAT repeat domain-containing protein [Gemmataceae bacterium]|nr:HEAT repeat domain-containing protein [Gemmataceae bacterium]
MNLACLQGLMSALRFASRLTAVIAILAVATRAEAQQEMSDDPAALLKLTQLPENFEMQLVAIEPDVVNPIQINFDPQGRLWVLCAPGYPQILPGQAPRDYVVVLEDFGPDGRAKKVRKFVEGLMVPTGMMPGDGGVYVGQGENLVHYRERDGKIEKRVVLTGFGTNDTHHTLNTFRWGPQGDLYFNQGVYIRSTVETPYGPRKLFGGAIWQLRTDRLKLEVFDRSIAPNNTWGHDFDAWGRSFIASAWPGALNQVLPDSPLQQTSDPNAVPPLKITQIGAERHCGLEIVGGRHLPDDMRGNFLTGDFLSHRIYRYQVQDLENRFVAKQLPPLVQSKHRKFRPIDIRMGPDGAIYVGDLYQQIIQHNQVDFRDPRRDHSRGRVWRIVRKDRPLVEIPKLVGVPLKETVARLKDPESWTRLHARRVLMEGDAKIAIEALDAFVAKLDEKDADAPRHLVEALWTYQSLDKVEPALLSRLLRSPDPRVRGAATKAISAWHDRLPAATRLLAAQAADPHPRVRLEAVLAATHIPSAEALQSALVALDHPTDPLLDFALRKAAIVLEPYWRPQFQAGKLTFGGKVKHLTFALQAVKAPDALPVLAKLIRNKSVANENVADILVLLAGSKDYRDMVLEQVASAPTSLTPADRVRVVESLEQSTPAKSRASWKDLAELSKLIGDESSAVASAGLRLAGAMHAGGMGNIEQIAVHPKTDPMRRRAAICALVRMHGTNAVKQLRELAGPDRPAEVRLAAIVGLAEVDEKTAADQAALLLKQPTPSGVDLEPLFTAFVQKKNGADALATALQNTKPTDDAARVGMRTLVALGVSPPALVAVLQGASGDGSRQRKLDVGETKRFLALVPKEGDPVRGEAVFRRPALGCLSCHAIGGAGGIVGPDLSGIGTSAQPDYLLESIILPSKIVREGYNTAHVVTSAGKVIRGIVQRETPKELVLRDPRGEELVIKADDIEEKKIGGSLMPDGIDRTLTDAELVDLVRFLSEIGKPGPFGVSHLSVARRWQILANPPALFATLDAKALGSALRQDASLNWNTAYSRISGDLPLAEIAKAPGVVFLRTQIEVVSPGKIGIRIGLAEGVQMWSDDTSVAASERVTIDLPRGMHTLTFRIDTGRRTSDVVRAELLELPSGGQARFVSQVK